MGGLRRFLQRLVNIIRSDGEEANLEREVASHLLLLEDEYRHRGLSDSEARRSARVALGGVERAKELHRRARSFSWVEDTSRDVRYAVRRLGGDVGFTLAVRADDRRRHRWNGRRVQPDQCGPAEAASLSRPGPASSGWRGEGAAATWLPSTTRC